MFNPEILAVIIGDISDILTTYHVTQAFAKVFPLLFLPLE